MSSYLKDKSAVVTGAGGGIGRAIALALAAEGAKVVVNDYGPNIDGTGSSRGPTDGVVREIEDRDGTAVANYDDVSKFESSSRIIAQCVDAFGGIDILVNNAGTSRPMWFWEMREEDFDAVVNVHLKGTFNCSRHAVEHMMRKRSGRIVHISSGAAIQGSTQRAAYGAGKGGIFGLTNTMSRDLGPHGITVNAVCPGPTDTRMFRNSQRMVANAQAGKAKLVEAQTNLLSINPEPPEDLAPLVVYLCTEGAANVNGQVLHSTGSKFGWYRPLEVDRVVYKSGRWTQDELAKIMPSMLLQGVANPAPKRT